MRSIVRFVTITGLVAASVSTLAAQLPRRPIRPLPPEPPIRERMLERREAIRERVELRAGMRERLALGRGAMGRGAMGGGRGLGRGGAGMRGRGAGLRESAIERRVIRRREAIREQIGSLKPAEREAMFKYQQSIREERFRAGEELQAGKITREQLRERMQKWREAHKPPVDLKARPKGE